MPIRPRQRPLPSFPVHTFAQQIDTRRAKRRLQGRGDRGEGNPRPAAAPLPLRTPHGCGIREEGRAGSMSRPEVEGIDFVDHVHLGVVELLARQDAVILTLCSVLPL